jgi:hypothetical protein
MKKILSVVSVLAVAGFAANAQVAPGAFAAEAIEDYENTGGNRTVISSLFGGTVGVSPDISDHTSVNAGDWFDFRSGLAIVPTSGITFGTIFGFDGFRLDFTGLGGILGFSGWGSDAGVDNGTTFEFFDMGGNPMTGTSNLVLGPGDGTMQFFSYVSTVAIGSIRISGPETAFDDLGYTTVPTPGAALVLAGAGLMAGRRRRA